MEYRHQRHALAVVVAPLLVAATLVPTPAAGPAVTAASVGPAGTRQAPDLSPKALVARTAAYVADYATKLKTVLASETYVQETFDSRDHRSGSRMMKGDLYLQFLPTDEEWIAVHDFAEVDGDPVTDREDLHALLHAGITASVARDVAARNARYNIGTIARNFNEPTLPLLIFGKKRLDHFKFSRGAVETDGEDTLVTLSFTEKERPTLVTSTTGQPVYSKGEIVIDAGTGQIRKTHLTFKYATITAELTTTYKPEPKLELWVPATFTEQYEGERNGLKEYITCTARYTDYRRFETSGRIKR